MKINITLKAKTSQRGYFKPYWIIWIILFLACNRAFSQENEREIWIHTNAFMNIDIMHPKINLGVEFPLNSLSRISFSGNIYYYNWFYEEPTHGFVLDVDYKRDFKRSYLFYSFGIKTGFINYDTDGVYISGDKNDTTSIIYSEPIKIEKFIGEINFKIGHRVMKRNLFYEFFIGGGVRFKNVEPIGRSNPGDEAYKQGFTAQSIRDNEGSYVLPVLKLGVMVGFKIK